MKMVTNVFLGLKIDISALYRPFYHFIGDKKLIAPLRGLQTIFSNFMTPLKIEFPCRIPWFDGQNLILSVVRAIFRLGNGSKSPDLLYNVVIKDESCPFSLLYDVFIDHAACSYEYRETLGSIFHIPNCKLH